MALWERLVVAHISALLATSLSRMVAMLTRLVKQEKVLLLAQEEVLLVVQHVVVLGP